MTRRIRSRSTLEAVAGVRDTSTTGSGVRSWAALAASGVIPFFLFACSSTVPNRDPRLEPFPSVTGESLAGQTLRIPEDFAGSPVVVMVGFIQDAQFDIDRWLLGIAQLQTPVRILEVPTIPGMIPGMFAGTIAEGMRSGIPDDVWPVVVTLYGGDASKVLEFFGNEKPRCARVALLNPEGRIMWFHDSGFGAGQMVELDRLARELSGLDSAARGE